MRSVLSDQFFCYGIGGGVGHPRIGKSMTAFRVRRNRAEFAQGICIRGNLRTAKQGFYVSYSCLLLNWKGKVRGEKKKGGGHIRSPGSNPLLYSWYSQVSKVSFLQRCN